MDTSEPSAGSGRRRRRARLSRGSPDDPTSQNNGTDRAPASSELPDGGTDSQRAAGRSTVRPGDQGRGASTERPASTSSLNAPSPPNPPVPRGASPKPARESTTRDLERNWRDLVGSSPSQVGIDGALRARDVARPTAQDDAEAEAETTVIRRNWQPPEG